MRPHYPKLGKGGDVSIAIRCSKCGVPVLEHTLPPRRWYEKIPPWPPLFIAVLLLGWWWVHEPQEDLFLRFVMTFLLAMNAITLGIMIERYPHWPSDKDDVLPPAP